MTCDKPLRDGPCRMDAGHRGRCSTVTFYCDGCGKARRGQASAVGTNPWDGVVEAAFCFMCTYVRTSSVER